MYRNCIFDLYGTLIDIKTSESRKSLWEKLCEFYAFNGAKYIYTELKRDYRRYLKIMYDESPSYTYTEIDIKRVFKKLYENKGVEADETLLNHTAWMFRILSTDYIKLYSGVENLLVKLRRENFSIYLLSNAQSIYTEYELEFMGIKNKFNGIILSSDEKVMKPSEEFFNILFDRYNIDKKNSIMIGDDYKNDIMGAYNSGIDSIYIDHGDAAVTSAKDGDKKHYTYKVDGNDFEGIYNILSK